MIVVLVCNVLQVKDVEAVNIRIKTDIHNCTGFMQEPKKLRDCVKNMFHTYVTDDVVGRHLIIICFFSLI